jgi:sortase B
LGALSGVAAQEPESSEKPAVLNQGIADLKLINGDIEGWIAIEGTNIDYPFVQGSDNDLYLGKDIYKSEAKAGAVFLDYRSEAGLSGPISVFYGHSMKNGKMFHDIVRFGEKGFFNEHAEGTVFLQDAIYSAEIFAFIETEPVDWPEFFESVGGEGFLDYLKSYAQRWRNIGVKPGDKLAVLSTCAYDFKDARAAIVARITRVV